MAIHILASQVNDELVEELTISRDDEFDDARNDDESSKNKPLIRRVSDLLVAIPFAVGRRQFIDSDDGNNDDYGRRRRITFVGVLRDEQTSIARQLVTDLRETSGCSVFASQPGFGKTVVSIDIACQLASSTASYAAAIILTNRNLIGDQWYDAIAKFAPSATVGVAKSNSPMPDTNFVIVNPAILQSIYDVTAAAAQQPLSANTSHAATITKRCSTIRTNLLIVDELHSLITPVYSRHLLGIESRYVLGLSATPYRFDEYDRAIRLFFGNVVRGDPLHRPHFVYCIRTAFALVPRYKPARRVPYYKRRGGDGGWGGGGGADGKTVVFGGKSTTSDVAATAAARRVGFYNQLDWSYVLDAQANDRPRNEKIVETICDRLDRTWLILVKRVQHAKTLCAMFEQRGVDCVTLVGSTKAATVAKSRSMAARVTVGTVQKLGIGYDDCRVDALCIAADVERYYVQFLGRCMRRSDVVPIVLDFVDSFAILERHFRNRLADCVKHGGAVRYVRRLPLVDETAVAVVRGGGGGGRDDDDAPLGAHRLSVSTFRDELDSDDESSFDVVAAAR